MFVLYPPGISDREGEAPYHPLASGMCALLPTKRVSDSCAQLCFLSFERLIDKGLSAVGVRSL